MWEYFKIVHQARKIFCYQLLYFRELKFPKNHLLNFADPELMHERQLKMEAARRKMQEENDLKAALHAEKMKEVGLCL